MIINADGPCKTFPDVLFLLMFGSITTYIVEELVLKRAAAEFVLNWGLVPARLLGSIDIHNLLTLLTHPFIQYHWTQLVIALSFMWIFGARVEDRMGSLRFLLFCILSDLIASLIQIFYYPTMEMPIIGLSNLVASLLGAFVVSYPDAEIVIQRRLGRAPSRSFSAMGIITLWLIYRTSPLFTPFLYLLMHLVSPSLSMDSIRNLVSEFFFNPETVTPDFFGDFAGFIAGIVLVKLLRKKDLNTTAR
jgi:membrane associated rhomboid family serine protease